MAAVAVEVVVAVVVEQLDDSRRTWLMSRSIQALRERNKNKFDH